MTRATMQRHAHGRKRLNYLEQRATEADVSHSGGAVAQPSPSSTKLPAKLPPTSKAALIAVGSVIGAALLLGIAICVYKRRKSRKLPSLVGKVTIEREYYSEKHIDLADVSIYTEKPQKAALSHRSIDTETNWVPQIRAHTIPNVPIPEPTASPKSKFKPAKAPLTVKTPSNDPALSPPSYYAATGSPKKDSQSPRNIPIPPSPPASVQSAPPPTPPANRRTKASFISLSEQPPLPSPSPRSESFAPHDVPFHRDAPRSPGDEHPSNERLPRLMSVSSTFEPSLEDELSIKVGDTVRMLEEYRDGWCLVQRVGRIDAPKGVVPRFCLQERRGVVPILPKRKFSNGSIHSQASGWR